MSVGLHLSGVTISLRESVLIPPLDCRVGPGEVVTIMGPSGSGKSTLLAYIGGFLDPAFMAGGEVFVGAERITRMSADRRRVGILFQDDLLFPHLSVGGNLAFGLKPAGGSRIERRRLVQDTLAKAGLDGFIDRDPATLSGGQRARVALLRTLLAGPRALLLDEPFGKLDRERREDIRRFVFDHARERRVPVLLVTHDPEDAADAGGEVVLLGS